MSERTPNTDQNYAQVTQVMPRIVSIFSSIWTESYPYFLVYDRISNSVQIQENTD